MSPNGEEADGVGNRVCARTVDFPYGSIDACPTEAKNTLRSSFDTSSAPSSLTDDPLAPNPLFEHFLVYGVPQVKAYSNSYYGVCGVTQWT